MASKEESGELKEEKEGNKPKLLIATDNFLPRWDGIARFLSELIPRLKEYKITVISPDYGVTPLDLTIRRILVPLQKKEYGDYRPAQWRSDIVKRAVEDADLIFCQTIGPIGLLTHRWAKKYKKPTASFIHNIEWELVPKALDKPILKRISRIATKIIAKHIYNRTSLLIVPSKNTAEKLTWQKIRTQKEVVHLGVDTKVFTRGDQKKARFKLKLPKEAFIVGFHGRIGNEKNLLTLSRAFVQTPIKNKRLLIVGEGIPSLKERLARVKWTMLPGTQENIVPWLQAMDVYVMPSFTETTSLAVLEAMSCELPVISSPVGYIRQYITHGKNGFFFETKSAYDLARKIKLLAENPELRARTGREARKSVKERFNWDNTAEGISKALRKIQAKTLITKKQ